MYDETVSIAYGNLALVLTLRYIVVDSRYYDYTGQVGTIAVKFEVREGSREQSRYSIQYNRKDCV